MSTRRIDVEHYLPGPDKQKWNADANVDVFAEKIVVSVRTHDGGYLRVEIERIHKGFEVLI